MQGKHFQTLRHIRKALAAVSSSVADHSTTSISNQAIAFVWATSVIALFLRSYPRLLSPQLWAEDGPVFLASAHRSGALESVTTPYAGYFHLIPRIIAEGSTLLPLEIAPFVFVWSAFTFVALALFLVLTSESSLEFKLACAIAFPLSVGAQEIYINLTNLHWFLAPYILSAATRPLRRLDFALLPLACATGPFALLALVAAISVNILAAANARLARADHLLAAAVLVWAISGLVNEQVAKADIVITTALASFVRTSPSHSLGLLFVAATMFGPILLWQKMSKMDKFLYVFLCVYWLSIGYKFSIQPGQPVLGGGGSRYFLVPQVIGIYAFFRLISAVGMLGVRWFAAVVLVGAMTFAQLVIPPLWPISGSYRETWLPQVQSCRNGKTSTFTHPPSWTLELSSCKQP